MCSFLTVYLVIIVVIAIAFIVGRLMGCFYHEPTRQEWMDFVATHSPLTLPPTFTEFNHGYHTHMLNATSHYQKQIMNRKDMSADYVRTLPLEIQKEYADPITRKYGLDVITTPSKYWYKSGYDEGYLFANTIGNMAWLSQFDSSFISLLDDLRKKQRKRTTLRNRFCFKPANCSFLSEYSS